MVDGSFNVPLSPPTSPRNSAYGMSTVENEWQLSSLKTEEHTPPHSDCDMTALHVEEAISTFDLKRPTIRSHKSFPYLLDSKSHSNGSSSLPTVDEIEPHDLPTVTFGGSAPTSPISRLTPPSTNDGNAEEKVEEEKPMTAAEIRAAKRKMKRFRLTHNQTRFLMSEFARQAHPDAAHRERLSREIPGLSPRQVQVWFQNR
jgi:hypothetical protein